MTYHLVSCEQGVLGSVSLNDGPRKDMNGWWFISAVSSHKNGRRAWSTAEEAIPAWARKRGAELAQMTHPYSLRLAHAFHRLVRKTLPEHLEAIDEENRTSEHTCATHDYLDANMLMNETFTAVFGRDMDAGSEDDAAAWNAAWDLAVGHGFSKEW